MTSSRCTLARLMRAASCHGTPRSEGQLALVSWLETTTVLEVTQFPWSCLRIQVSARANTKTVPGTPTTRTAALPSTVPGDPVSGSTAATTTHPPTSTTAGGAASSTAASSTSRPTTTAPTQTKTTTAASLGTPTPIQSSFPASCNRFYLVQPGDGCWAIANSANIPLATFYDLNPAVGTDCSGLLSGFYVCLGLTSKRHVLISI